MTVKWKDGVEGIPRKKIFVSSELPRNVLISGNSTARFTPTKNFLIWVDYFWNYIVDIE